MNSFENKEDKHLKWRFDVSTFRLIGRDLITDRITAIIELVKNSYDANAKRVDIIFENVLTINKLSKIIIKDDGYGMSFSDIKNKWMVIGTTSKRKNPYSPEPFNRRCVGEKGIGRFAVDKLGEKVNIITKQKNTNKSLIVTIDWQEYFIKSTESIDTTKKTDLNEITKITGSLEIAKTIESIEVDEKTEPIEDNIQLFTDIENNYKYIDAEIDTQGTTLEIENTREIWTNNDLLRLEKELSKIVSPFYPLNPPFHIYITAKEFNLNEKLATADTVQYSSHQEHIKFDLNNNTQQTLFFNDNTGLVDKKNIPIKSFGGIEIRFYFFDEQAKRIYNKAYKNDDTRIDGIKIYRDGIITTPFAEFEADRDKKRDILGIDKRLWKDIFNRISTREVIGLVDISKKNNPQIVDATNRQDFIDNQEYRDLKNFIVEQLDAFENLKKYSREIRKQTVTESLKVAEEDVNLFALRMSEVARSNPSLKKELAPVIEQAKQTNKTVVKAIKEHKEAEKEFERKEKLYKSIMSLQEYAIHIAHAVRTSLGKIQRKAEYFHKFYPDPEEEEYFKLYSKEIYEEMLILDKVINFMLSYSQSNLSFTDIKIKKLVEDLFDSYSIVFQAEQINTLVDMPNNFQIYSNRQFFIDILQQLISNSIKALKKTNNKIIKCSGYVDGDKFRLLFSDNGEGISPDKREWVFGLYNTTTEETGGAGIGLYTVKTSIESLKGEVKVIDSEFNEIGTTIEILLPFNK